MCRKQQQRIKARQLVKLQLTIPLLRKAQNNKCCICFERFGNTHDDISVDHVNSMSTGGDNAGNLLLAHAKCNMDKSDAPPSERTLEMLTIVNWIFDYQPWKNVYAFDMRVLKSAWTYYQGLKIRRERHANAVHAHTCATSILSIKLIDAQLREIEEMTKTLDTVHYRCQLSERMF